MALADKTTFRYLIFSLPNNESIGICAIQILDFKGATTEQQDQLCFFARKIQDHIIAGAGFKVVTCGNAFACGENGFAFKETISEEVITENLTKALKQVQKLEKENFASSLILLKEFWPTSAALSDHFKNHKYTDFSADVNMVVNLKPEWLCFQDYLDAMQAKFRTKANAASKRSEDVICKSFTATEIESFNPEITHLYTAVAKKSPYTFGELTAQAFANFKRNLGDDFIFNGYFLDGKLVCFSTAFKLGDVIDANYVGINYKLNQHYALYPRMLYDFVRLAIEQKATTLRLGRTAEEMKSSIGAEPVDMRLYIRPKKSLSNQLIRPIFSAVKPSDFALRKPFKQEIYEAWTQ